MLTPEGIASLSATLLAINPLQLKGVVLRGARGDCEAWLQSVAQLQPHAPLRRISPNIPEERLLGGLDFAATISLGHAVYEHGLLAAAHGGAIVLSANTTQKSTWRHVTRTLDNGAIAIERDGFSERHDASFIAIALQCGDDDECPPAFLERVAFIIDVPGASQGGGSRDAEREMIAMARGTLAKVVCDSPMLTALCEGASRFGIASLRTVVLAVSVARSCAALHGRTVVSSDDIACAAALVFAPRALHFDDDATSEEAMQPSEASAAPEAQAPQPQSESRDANDSPTDADASKNVDDRALADVVVNAVRTSLPAGLLTSAAARIASKAATAGRAGETQSSGNRGRQVGTRKGDPRGGARLDIVATLRAAVPWQRLRKAARATTKTSIVELRRDDFRIRKCVSPGTTTTLFVVDASGSSALHRLAEVKGAIEMMLADGYARRERVAVIAFRGTVAELLLPPTHALARARRAVAGMPAGGGTPIASALDLTARVVQTLKRDAGQTVVVILSDGQANVARDGKGGRLRADADALDAAVRLRALHDRIVWIDSSPRPYAQSKALASAMNARFVALPMANASGLRDVAQLAHT